MSRLLLGTLELEVPQKTAKRTVDEPKPGILKAEDILYWFDMPGPPKDWQYAFIDDDILNRLNDGEECYALTLPSLGLVLFAKSLLLRKNRGTLQVVFGHEMLHVGLNTDGGAHTTKQAFGAKSDKTANDREEAVCGLWSNNAAPSLFRCGVLRFPKLPRIPKSA